MSKYQKLGSFLLFEKVEEDKLSKDFVAGRIVNNQIQDFTVLKKFDQALSTTPDFILDLNQEYQILKELANPTIIKPSALVQEKTEFAAVFDYFEGKSLRAVLTRCAQEGHPFTAEYGLLIASRLCVALEYLHSKKVDGERLVHGFIGPETVQITYDGETKLQYLGLARTLMRFSAGREKYFAEQRNYVAPEVLQTHRLDRPADIYAIGLLLFEMLTGHLFSPDAGGASAEQSINNARMANNSGDKIPFTPEIKRIIGRAVMADPNQRYASAGDMRKEIDQYLFNSEFAPTTFNLAFFMNTIFRENIDEENKHLTDFKKVDVSRMGNEDARRPEHPVGAEAAKDIPVVPLAPGRDAGERISADFLARETPARSSKTFILAGAGVALLVGAVAVFMFQQSDAPVPPTDQTATPQPAASTMPDAERQRLQMEAQKAQDEARKKDEALKELQSKLDALLKTQQAKEKQTTQAAAVDSATIRQLQEQARLLEEEKKRQEFLAAQKIKAVQTTEPEPSQVAQETKTEPVQQDISKSQQMVASASPPPVSISQEPASMNPSSTLSTNTAMQQPQQQKMVTQQPAAAPANSEPQRAALREGDTVEMTPDVMKPELVNRANPTYPPAALAKKIEGTVILSILVSENGGVADVKVLRGAGGPTGLNEAAISAARKWKFRPAVKEGKKVKVWVTYPIVFRLQQ